MNKVLLTGRITKEISLNKSKSQKSFTQNSIAVKREYKNEQGEYETDFINIVVWGVGAEYLSKYGHKGDLVEIVGKWQNRAYTNKNNQEVHISECIVENVSILQSTKQNEKKLDNNNVATTDSDFEDVSDDNIEELLPF
jgi:single-strand DNA-binding protein